MSEWKNYFLNDILFNRNECPDAIDVAEGIIPIISKIGFANAQIEIRSDGISNTKLISVYPNDLVISGINVEKGAVAINNYNKIIAATIHYSAYYPNNSIVELTYLWYFLRSNEFKFYLKQSFPAGIKTEIKPNKFLSIQIPLPPLSEQKRIVAKIESVKSKIEAIQKLRAEQEKEMNNLRNCIFLDLQNEFENISIGDVLVNKSLQVAILPNKMYKQVTVRMEHKGVTQRGIVKGSEIGSKQFLANEGDFIISKIDARNGAMGMIPTDLDGAIVTADFPLFKLTENVNPLFFYHFSNTHYFDNSCKQASEGTTNRKRLKLKRFENIKMPLPPIEEQNRIVGVLEKANRIKEAHQEQEKELTELLPSLLDKAFKGEL